jgi:hypothetical protein
LNQAVSMRTEAAASLTSPPLPGSAELLVCVYYRVTKKDTALAIDRVRDIQRTLSERFAGVEAQVLVRCALTRGEPSVAAPTESDAPNVPEALADADATLMETYRYPLPARADRPAPGGPIADAGAARFLQALESAATPLQCLQRGARHVEVFMPCAS